VTWEEIKKCQGEMGTRFAREKLNVMLAVNFILSQFASCQLVHLRVDFFFFHPSNANWIRIQKLLPERERKTSHNFKENASDREWFCENLNREMISFYRGDEKSYQISR
jgi:hypothetical protein